MELLKQQTPIPFQIRFKKRLKLVIEKKWIVIGLCGIGILLALAFSLLLPKQYRTSSRISFKYNSVNNSLLNNNGSLENEISNFRSKKVLSNASEKLLTKNTNISISDLFNKITFLEDRPSTSIVISSIAEDAELTSDITNAVMTSFYEESKLNSRGPYLATLKLISDRLKEIQSIRGTTQTLSSSSLNINEERIITRLSEFESELENIEIDNQFYSTQSHYLKNVLEKEYSMISTQLLNISVPELANNKLRIERLEAKKTLSGVSQKIRNYTISYPWSENFRIEDLPKLNSEYSNGLIKHINNLAKDNNIKDVGFLKKLVVKLYESRIMVSSIDLSKSIIFNILNGLEGQFNLIPFANLDNARQVRSSGFQNKLLIKLKTKELKLKEKQKKFFAEIDSITKAEVPGSFFSPNIPLNLFLGGLFGFIAGVILVAASKKTQLELITKTDELEEAGYKIISQIPTFPAETSLLLDSVNNNEKKNLSPNIIKSFEGIETFLKYGNLEKSLKTILITSGYEGEGKSLVASNIAIALSKQGNNVLLVDADLKKPDLNKYFKIKSTPSLAHYLFRKKELEDIIRGTHCKNLDLITCIEFPQNPSVIITSERMKNFMDQVKKDYDYVVYDTSSLCQLKETVSMAKRVDEVILVVRANKTKYSELYNTEKLLQEGGVTNFNVVLNDVNN